MDRILDEFLYTLKESGGLEDVEIEYIPASGSERENMLDRIRTEIMTGGGPDVFIVNCSGSATGDVGTSLFPMPLKVMENGLFLPLDEYMEEKTRFTEWDKLTQSVLKAGSNEEGQQIIPLTYTLPVLCYRQSEGTVEAAPDMTWTEMLEDECLSEQGMLLGDVSAPFAGIESRRMYLEYIIGDLADYHTDKLLFTEEELLQYVRQAYDLWETRHDREDSREITDYFETYLDVGFVGSDTPVLYNIGADEPLTMVPVYSEAGGVTASITSFAAVNRNTRRPDDAYTVIDLLLRDVVQQRYLLYRNLICADSYGIPMHEDLMQEEMPTGLNAEWYLSDENYAELSKVRDQITTVFFQDTLSMQFMFLQMDCEFAIRNGEEERLEDIVSEHYRTMKLLMAE
ncbi:MAG: carbohydrate ABC transporter substrate-binding protein [Clostridia bacterium]|nr:carbohydrate ABC transporter substrate-binding protein [Clostridia bacterium]